MRRPLAYLARALLLPGLLVLAGVAAVWGPWSPLAMDRANEEYLRGDLAAAERHYEQVAEGWHAPDTRAEAAERAGLLHARRGDREGAIRWLRRAVDLQPDREARGALRAQLAALFLPEDPEEAASAYERAALDDDDGRHLVEAAQLWEDLGRADRALVAWQSAVRRLEDEPGPTLDLARQGLADARRALDGASDAIEEVER